ncbi:efflux RND transporter permease subunit [Marinobacter sp.]|uniref:efflux RND transporter permease subunit n=1 Tax=Marinobacter sp. TaxID=50741 RepID=UPI0019BFC985|nr:efflux RND transporter permease subunit [Marinobacter sp.]MBD3657116.1 efflux RND transporter permease subunit [Marinobacter sp.]
MTRWFAAHPTASNLLLILILATGVFAAPNLTRETFPDYLPPEVSITMEYRGATAADVEETLCQRLDDALQRVDYLKEFSCTARDNQASAVASMDDRGDMGRFLDDLRTEIEALTDLPEQAEAAVIRQRHRTDLVAAVAVSGPMSFNDLESYASRLEDRLFRLPGVADVVTRGLSQRQWQVEISRQALRQYGLSMTDIAATIRQQNLDMPLGTLETRGQDIQLRFVDQRRSPRELMTLAVISSATGAVLQLGDIATVRETHERAEDKILFNDQRAIILEVHKNRHEDALRVMAALEEVVDAERTQQHGTVSLDITQDMTSIVRDRLQMLVSNGIVGLLLVGLVMSLFFRPRLALWALFGLPAAFAGAFVVMALTGLSLNMITLVALLMAIGIVMDDSVVITDNIADTAAAGSSPLQAAVSGTTEVLPGVLSSFLTTVSVFIPLAFLAGELGSVLEVLPVVLIAALAASLVEAFWILPHHLKAGLSGNAAPPEHSWRARFNRRFEQFREQVGRSADGAIRYRYPVLAALLLLLFGSIGFMAGGHVKMEAMPEIDGDVLEARLLMPQGTPLARTEQVAGQVAAAMGRLNEQLSPQQPGQQPLVENLQIRFNHNPSANETGGHVATVMVDLLTAENRATTLAELTRLWYQAAGDIPGILSLNIQEPGFGPAGIPIELRLHGNDLTQLKQAAQLLTAELAAYHGTFNVLDDLRPGKPQRILTLREGALEAGLSAADVANQLRTGLLGEIVDTIQIDDQHIELLVRQSAEERGTRDFLRDTSITSRTGTAIPLTEVVEVTERRNWAQITRIDGRRTVTVTADIDSRTSNAAAIVADLRKQVFPQLADRFEGLEIVIEGQVARSEETGKSIARGLLIGLLGIFLILSFQFRSYVEPLIVMLSIPLALLGSVWGHVLMGYNLSMPSLIGAASLAGIVVNNAILLVQFIKAYRRQGLSVREAAGQASRDRFRAIFITSGTTIAGLLPLLAETSTQAMAVIPLVISVVFGLLASTVLVLLALPALYVMLDDLGMTRPQD